MYLPPDAPSRPGLWHLPQVRAQALTTLIEDVCGWVRNLHGLLVVLLGGAGAGALVLATSNMVTGGVLLWLLISVGVLALAVWAIWGIWLERGAWRAIAATGRWHAAYIRGTGASGQIVTPSVRDVFTAAMIVRLLVGLLLLAGAVGITVATTDEPATRRVALGVLALVLAVAALSALSTCGAMVAAFRRGPSPQARARAQGQPLPDPRAGSHPAYQLAPPHAGVDAAPGQWAPGPVPAAPPVGGDDGPGPVPPPPGTAAAGAVEAPVPVAGAAGAPGGTEEDAQYPPRYGGEEFEQTRLASRLGPVPADTRTRTPDGLSVLLPDGRHVPNDAVSLIGRDPQPRPGETVDALLKIADRSVSKTHLTIRVTGRQVWATDRASTNGTVLRGPDGTSTDLAPWAEHAVPVGSTLTVGGTTIEVLLAQDVDR